MDDKLKDEHKMQQISPYNHNQSKILFINYNTIGSISYVTDDGHLSFLSVQSDHFLRNKEVLCFCKEHKAHFSNKLNKNQQNIYYKAYEKAMEIKDFTFRSTCIGCSEAIYSFLLVVINDKAITLACDGTFFGLVKAYEAIEICELLSSDLFYHLTSLYNFTKDPDGTYFSFFSEHLPNPTKISKQRDANKCIKYKNDKKCVIC